MENEHVKSLIQKGFPEGEIQVMGDGCDLAVTVISNQFSAMNPMQKQQAVYATVVQQITSGEIHALSIKAFTPEEWKNR